MNFTELNTKYDAVLRNITTIQSEIGEDLDVTKTELLGTGTPEERSAAFIALLDERDTLKIEVDKQTAIQERAAKVKADAEARAKAQREAPVLSTPEKADTPEERARIYATPNKFGSLRNFKGEKADERAYRFGKWLQATIGNNPDAFQYCRDQGIPMFAGSKVDNKSHEMRQILGESVNQLGGYLVPNEFLNILIDLKEEYGVFRANAKRIPMTSASTELMIRQGHAAATWVAENGTISTDSTQKFGRVTLTPKKLGDIVIISNELSEDAIINVADDAAMDIAYAFALAEDQAGFLGDGTSTYGNIQGLKGAIAAVSSNAGIVVATAGSGAAYSAVTLTDCHKMIGTCPVYALKNAKWYVSQYVASTVFQKLQTAAGGNTTATIGDGPVTQRFLGYPVVVSQVLPTTAANNQIFGFFGDLRLGAILGERREMTLTTNVGALNTFESDQIAIRATERIDINIPVPGTSSVAGPVLAFKTASS